MPAPINKRTPYISKRVWWLAQGTTGQRIRPRAGPRERRSHQLLARAKTQIKRKRHTDDLRDRLEQNAELAIADRTRSSRKERA